MTQPRTPIGHECAVERIYYLSNADERRTARSFQPKCGQTVDDEGERREESEVMDDPCIE